MPRLLTALTVVLLAIPACGGDGAEPPTTTTQADEPAEIEFPGDAVSLLGDLESEGMKFGTPVVSLGKLDGQLNGVAAAGNYRAEVYETTYFRAAAVGDLVDDGLVEGKDFVTCQEGFISNQVKQDPSVPAFDVSEVERMLLKLYGDC